MNNQDMKKTAIWTLIFAVFAMTIMIYRSFTRHVLISDASLTRSSEAASNQALNESYDLTIGQLAGRDDKTISIPLPASVTSDKITIDNDYYEHELNVIINDQDHDFYRDKEILCSGDFLNFAICRDNTKSEQILTFHTDALYVTENVLTENGSMEITFSDPREGYSQIVLVDYADQDMDSDLMLKTSDALRKLAKEDHKLKIFFTNTSDKSKDLDAKLRLLTESEADRLIILAADHTASDGLEIVAAYNDIFYIRKYGNGNMARDLAVYTATALGTDKAILEPAKDNEMLAASRVPSTQMTINMPVEGDLVDPTKLAEGIYSAIKASYKGEL